MAVKRVIASPVRVASPIARSSAVLRASPSPIRLNPPPKVITKAGPIPIRDLGKRAVTAPAKESKPVRALGKRSVAAPAKQDKPIRALGKRVVPDNSSPQKVEEQSEANEQYAQPERYVQYVYAQPESQSSEQEQTDEEEYEEEEYEECTSDEDCEWSEREEYEKDEIKYEDETGTFFGEPVSIRSIPLVSSHVHNGVMHTAAVAFSPHGCDTVVTRVGCPKADQNGLVLFNGENPEWLNAAVDKTKYAILRKANEEAPKREIGSIVRRARAGDQNAMGIIAMVKTRSDAGDAKAVRSARLMREYIDSHPANDAFGNDANAAQSPKDAENKLRAVIVLANGPPLDNSKIREFVAQFGEEKHKKAFMYGVIEFRQSGNLADLEKRLDEYSKSIVEVGRTIGEARAIQMVRLPNSSITKFDSTIGWELGE